MQHPPPNLTWYAITFIGLLAFASILNAAALNLSLLQCLYAIGSLTAVLLLAWLCQVTLRRPARPMTLRGWLWNALVLLAVLTFLGFLFWWTYEPQRQ